VTNTNSNQNTIISGIKKLVNSSRTMTIATANESVAWAAPVYYVNLGACFFFFSNQESRHIKETLASGQAACSIYEENTSWKDLKGLQLSGQIKPSEKTTEAARVILLYLKKFPMVNTFFSSVANVSLSDFQEKFNAKLYCFKPHLCFYMDNTIKFGFREEVNLSDILG
jgi:uncharacterized protein YhbP (UPF0306 family)